MNIFQNKIFAFGILVGLLLSTNTFAQEKNSDEAKFYQTPDSLVKELYHSVTFEAGASPDWDKVRSMFIKEAIVVLRTSQESTTIFSVEEFVQDFVNFIDKANVKQTGFLEEIIRIKPIVFGDMAHILVLYEASIPGSPRPPQKGVDSFQLLKKDGRWWIVSITNEIPTQKNPVPEYLLN